MSSKSKIVFWYGLAGLCIGAAAGIYTANSRDEGHRSQKFDIKRGAQLGLALFDFVQKASKL